MATTNGMIKARKVSAIGIEILASRLIVQTPDTCRLIMREDEARELRDDLDKQLAELERVNNAPAPKIGRPKGSRNLRKELIKKINAMERKDKAAAKRAAKGKSKTSTEPESMTPPAHKL